MKDFRSDFGRLLRLIGPGWRGQALGVLLGILVILTNVGLLALSGWFIAAMGLAGLGLIHIDYFVPAAAIRALAILRTIGRYLERLVTHDATLRLLSDLRVWFFTHLEPLAPAGLQRHRTGDLLSRIRADIDSLDNAYLRVIAPSITAFVCAIAILLFLARFSLGVALIDLAGLLAVGFGLPALAFRTARCPGAEAIARRGLLRAEIADRLRGQEELLVFGALERETARQEAAYARLDYLKLRETRVEAAAGGAGLILMQGTMLAGLLLLIPATLAGQLSGPQLALITLLLLASFEAVSALPTAYRALGQTMAAARRIFEIVDTPAAVPEPATEAPLPTRFDITFRHVSFRYPGSAAPALQDISLHLAQGQALGIIGPTGSGKTTLINLLLRFWDFEEGEILLGGVPIRTLSGEMLRGLCAVIAQQTHLFNTSIRENLRIARPQATEAEMEQALEAAGMLAEVRAMVQGLDTMVGELGMQVSGGQARRIAIARAFLKDAPILLLDEPTEGLDAFSERAVADALARLMRGRTSLVISHRPQVLLHVDQLIELEAGHVARRPSSTGADRRTLSKGNRYFAN